MIYQTLYRNCLIHALKLLPSQDIDGFSFGAKSVPRVGRRCGNGWEWYATAGKNEWLAYSRMLPTNSGEIYALLERIKETNPELLFIDDIAECCRLTGSPGIWEELSALQQDDLIVKSEVICDAAARNKIAGTIRKAAIVMDKAAAISSEKMIT